MTFSQWLAANKYDESALSDAQRKHLEAAWRAETQPAPAPEPKPAEASFDQKMAAIEAEDARVVRIRELTAAACEKHIGNSAKIGQLKELCAAAVEDKKTDVRAFELALLRTDREIGPLFAQRQQGADLTDKVVEAAVCRGAGLNTLAKNYDERTLEAADRHFPRGMSLSDLIMHYAKRGGYSGHSVKANPEAAWKAARRADLTDMRAAGSWGPSTQGASIGGMLAAVANKFFRAGFEAVDTSWRAISARRSAPDFKAMTTYSLTGDLTFQKLPPGGEIKHGTIDATSYTNQLDTYARMLGLDRRDIINDDIGAFASVARRLGRGGALALNTLFWTTFLNNAAFFTAGRNNLITGIASPYLTAATLDAANQKFVNQTDADGNPVAVMPAILLVPPALEGIAKALMSSQSFVSGSTTNPQTNQNIWAGAFRVVSNAYLSNSAISGSSASTWYLLADPNDMPTIEVAFLNGNETPTVEEADSDFGMLGQSFRGYFDIGVALQEYRGGVKNTA